MCDLVKSNSPENGFTCKQKDPAKVPPEKTPCRIRWGYADSIRTDQRSEAARGVRTNGLEHAAMPRFSERLFFRTRCTPTHLVPIRYDKASDRAIVTPCKRVAGAVVPPPDKSIAQRASLLAAVGDGTSRLVNYPSSADPLSTLRCLRQLGIQIEKDGNDLLVRGKGLDGFSAPAAPLDCGNSGTTMRLISGLLAGRPFESVLTGDASLRSRPMERVARPLRAMGARITLNDGCAPMRIERSDRLRGMEYRLPMPSAQVKSCVLLAGLRAQGRTTVIETLPSRDHTERMLNLTTQEDAEARRIFVDGGASVPARPWIVPNDFSSAAFFLVAAAIAPQGSLLLKNVCLNPTRSALVGVLEEMGARIRITDPKESGGEPVGDLHMEASALRGVRVDGARIPLLIDEIPILAVAGALAEGRTEIRDARELRFKETDRIAAMAENLRRLGASVEEFDDGLAVDGPAALHGNVVASRHDHRVAMAMAVAGLTARGETVIEHASCADVSFPNYWKTLASVVS